MRLNPAGWQGPCPGLQEPFTHRTADLFPGKGSPDLAWKDQLKNSISARIGVQAFRVACIVPDDASLRQLCFLP